MLRSSRKLSGVAACAQIDCAGMDEGSQRRVFRRWGDGWAQVAERLMAADCKSAAPCELRRFESSPVHHKSGF